LNGHSDSTGGESGAHASEEEEKIISFSAPPARAYLPWLAPVSRGIRTRPFACYSTTHTASAVARHLDAHPKIKKVYYHACRLIRNTKWPAPTEGPGRQALLDVVRWKPQRRLLNHVKLCSPP